MRPAPAPLDVTAIGLITSVGRSAFPACAAIRAGISRPGAVVGFDVLDLAAHETVPLTGHPITPITEGFASVARWLQLAPRAFADLIAVGRLPGLDDAGFWSRTGLTILLPRVDDPRFEHDPRAAPDALPTTFLRPLLRRLPPSLPTANIQLHPQDRTGLVGLVADATKTLAERRLSRLIVLAVDSYLDPLTLQWLDEASRLKSDLNPVGLMPGEAGAALLLEPSGRGREAPFAQIVSYAEDRDGPALDDDAPPRGRALAAVMRATVSTDTGDLYLDLNGEEWRAHEYGHALVQMDPGELDKTVLRHPAAELGDTGSVSMVLNTALATRSLQRGYSHGTEVIVAASSERGEVGALALRRVETK